MTFVRSVVVSMTLAAALASLSGCAADPPAPAATPAQTATATATPPPAAGTPAASADPTVSRGQRWTKAFYDGDTQAMWDSMSADMHKALGSKEALDAFRAKAVAELGAEASVVDEKSTPTGGLATYLRTARFARAPKPIRVSFTFDPEGHIMGFWVKPAE